MTKKRIATAALMILTGCASYRPIPTDAEHKPFRSYVIEQMTADQKTSFDIPQVSKALSSYVQMTLGALKERAGKAWDASDATTAGAGGAVLGSLADKTGLLNAGMFLAAAGLTSSARYKQEQQVDISLATFRRLSCMQGRLGMLTPEVLRLARTSGDEGAVDAVLSAPEDAIRSIEQVQESHLASFYALKATVPTKTELLDYIGRYSAAQTAAGVAGAAVRASKSAESEAAAKLVRTLSVELEACAKLA